MKYSAAVLSMAAVAVARPSFTNLSFGVTEGEPFTLEFTGCDGGCTISLKNGERGDLKDVQELTTAAEGGSFTFTPESLSTDTYTFEIVNNETGEDNYSQQFSYEGEAAEPTATSVTTVETETVTSSIVETVTTSSSTEESTTEATSTEESTMTTPSNTASTTVTETASTTVSGEATTTTSGDGSEETSSIPDPDDAAMALGSPMTLVVAAVAGLLMFN